VATRLCAKVFGFVKRNLSGAQRRKDAASGQRGAGKGGRPCPASAHSNPGARFALRLKDIRGYSEVSATMKARCQAFLLGFACVPFACAQIFGDAPGKGAAQSVDADCNTFAQVAKQFLNSRGLKVAQGYTKVDEDWACGQPGYRCIVFRNAPPRTTEGKSLSRDEVVSGYLSGPVDFRWKNLTRGYWAAPDHNFAMAASLQLKEGQSYS
jgi:hypothetical protein